MFRRKPKAVQEPCEPNFRRVVEVRNGIAAIAVRAVSSGYDPYSSHYSGGVERAREMRDALTAAIEDAQRLEGACAAAMAGQK